MRAPIITGDVDPTLRARIDWLQEYIDEMVERHTYVPSDVLNALYNKKRDLTEMV
jgi:hypothetical protein